MCACTDISVYTQTLRVYILLSGTYTNSHTEHKTPQTHTHTHTHTNKNTQVIAKKGLGEASSDEEDNAAAWVQRARKKQKEAAEKLAKKLAEQDEQEQEDYTSADLAGMKVLHDSSAFETGETVILTLADSRVLKRDFGNTEVNEDEDVLENVNLSEFEKTAIAKERAKKRAKYQGVDDDEFTEGGKSTNVLSKYDEFVVDGKKIGSKEDRKSIRLGAEGEIDLNKEERQKSIREKLMGGGSSGKIKTDLSVNIKEEASYLTAEEMAQVCVCVFMCICMLAEAGLSVNIKEEARFLTAEACVYICAFV